jgi:hypothetical protein
MSELFINMHPEAFQGFLSVFKEIHEGGDVFCYLENYQGETIKPKDLIEIMEQSHYSVFGVAAHLPEQIKKMKMDVIEEDGHHFLALNIAPFLGLPGNNPIAELRELKGLLEWLKEEVITNYQSKIYLAITRYPSQTELKVISDSDELEARLQSQFNEKVTNSPVLTQWKNIQQEGFKLDNPQCKYLTARMSMLELLNMTEQMELMQKNVDKNQDTNKKKSKIVFL